MTTADFAPLLGDGLLLAPREPLQVLPLPVRCVLRTRVAVPGLPVNFAQA